MEKSKRVKTKQDFQSVISNQKRKSSTNFVIYFKKNNLTYPRFGLTASRKLGCAVQRVKIRRQVRAMLREITKENKIQPNDYVIIVRKPYIDHTYQENLENLRLLLKKWRNNNE